MRKIVGEIAVVVGILFALVGAVALLKTGQILIGIASLIGGGVILAIGLILRARKGRRSAKRSSGRTKRRPSKTSSRTKSKSKPAKKTKPTPTLKPTPKPVSKPVRTVAPAPSKEKERVAPAETEEPLETSAPQTDAPVADTVDVGAAVESLVGALKGVYAYESDNAVAKVKEVTCTLTDEEVYEIVLDVEISFFQGKVADEESSKAETNHIIAAINAKLKDLRAELDDLGVAHDVSANYDFNE